MIPSLFIPLLFISYTESQIDFKDISNLNTITECLYEITEEIDLMGCTINIPDRVILKFNGGVIKNGTLVGNNTSLIAQSVAFDRVTIKGEWNIPIIHTSLFKDLNYNNSLKDVFALTNENIENKVIIEKGEYRVFAEHNGESILNVKSNTEVIVNGTIRLLPNNFESYNIISINGDNIQIRGQGTIIGDRYSHTGAIGEWGMGVMISGARISIKDLHIAQCWGDCVYIGGCSQDVSIQKCVLEDGRRQGISITSATGVKIDSCNISGIQGTDPEYAIDIEPNADHVVENVDINNVIIERCRGGVSIYGRAENARVGSIRVNNCKIYGKYKPAVSLIKCESAIIKNCHVIQDGGQRVIDCQDVLSLDISNIKMHYIKRKHKIYSRIHNLLDAENVVYIRTFNCNEKKLTNIIVD